MVIELPKELRDLIPFPFLSVGSRRRESQFGIASLSDLFRDPENSLNTKIWTRVASSSIEVSKGILTLTANSSGNSFVRVKDKHSWKGSVDGPAIWQARIKINRQKGGGNILCEFGLINSNQTDGIFFWAGAAGGSETTMTPGTEDGTSDDGPAFTVVDNIWHTYKIEADASNSIKFYLDNVLKDTITDSNDIPWTKELTPYFRVTDVNGSAEVIIESNWIKMAF